MGENEETMEERRNDLDKLGFEWRLRVFDDSVEGDGTPEEFSILCEGLQVFGISVWGIVIVEFSPFPFVFD